MVMEVIKKKKGVLFYILYLAGYRKHPSTIQAPILFSFVNFKFTTRIRCKDLYTSKCFFVILDRSNFLANIECFHLNIIHVALHRGI